MDKRLRKLEILETTILLQDAIKNAKRSLRGGKERKTPGEKMDCALYAIEELAAALNLWQELPEDA
jgi:hypothetical protein